MSPPQKPILKTIDLTKTFGGLVAVNKLNLSFYAGQIQSIIGPNGAGKTTFFNLLTGMFRPTSGKIYFKDSDITGFNPIQTFSLRMVRTFQQSSIFPQLTVLKNTEIAAQGRFRSSNSPWGRLTRKRNEIRQYCMKFLAQFKLDNISNLKAGLLAYGDKRRLEMVMGLASEPDLLLLDEPTAGMSIEETHEATQYIKDLAKDITILLVEHDMNLVMGISDRVTVLHRGEVLADGSPKHIQENPIVQSVYLGDTGSCNGHI